MEIAIIFALIVLGSFLQGATGFGFPFFVVPTAAIIAPELIPGTLAAVSIAVSTDVVWREWRNIVWRETWLITAGRMVGAVAGAYFVTLLSISGLKLLVALVVGSAIVLSFIGAQLPLSVPVLMIAGLISGVFGTATTIGGPPVALLYQHQSGAKVRAVLGSVLWLGAMVSVFWLWVFGRFTLDDVTTAAIFLPGVAIGLLLARRGAVWLDAGRTRQAILALSAAACLVLIVDAIFRGA